MNTVSKIACFAVFFSLLSVTESFAVDSSSKDAVCSITSSGKVHTVNDCIVTCGASDKYDWIFLERKDAEPLLNDILLLSVYETGPAKATVSGITSNGDDSNWGEAVKQGNCYAGSDFRICIKDK